MLEETVFIGHFEAQGKLGDVFPLKTTKGAIGDNNDQDLFLQTKNRQQLLNFVAILIGYCYRSKVYFASERLVSAVVETYWTERY